MKNKFITLILALSMSLCLSCSREIPPVFEIYVTFKNAEKYDQININVSYAEYGSLDQMTKLPSGSGTISFDSRSKSISKMKFDQKTFITSVAQNIGMSDFLSLNGSLELHSDQKINSVFFDKRRNVFPVNFNPEFGEAYELNFIIDIENSIVPNGNGFDFKLGGDSKVVITKY